MAAARNCDWTIYVGRLVKCLRTRDVQKMLEGYGRMLRCDIKYDTEMAYAFIDFQVKEDAEDCVKFENGREVNGQNIIVEWAKERKDRGVDERFHSSSQKLDRCFRCRRMGHWVRDCTEVGRLGRWRGGGGGSDERSKSPIRRSKSRDRHHRRHSRSHDRRRCSRSKDKKRGCSRSGDRKRSRSGSSRSRSASNNRKTSRAPGVGP